MDEIVQRAMAKWPDVPAVFGWLALDLRGQWLIRQEPIGNPLLVEFIGRNYGHDEHGRWFFQNGPQRVFVALAYAPWILRIGTDGTMATHTGRRVASLEGAWMDRRGIIVLQVEHGAAVIDDRDVESISHWLSGPHGAAWDEDRVAESLERTQAGEDAGLWLSHGERRVPLLPVRAEEVPAQLAFVREPKPLPGEKAAY